LREFDDAVGHDLNMPEALAAVWTFLRSAKLDRAEKHVLLKSADQVLGLRLFEEREKVVVPADIEQLIRRREQARRDRDFAQADALRREIAALGYVLEDTPQGPKVKPAR